LTPRGADAGPTEARCKATERAVIVFLKAIDAGNDGEEFAPARAADGEARKSDPVCDGVSVVGGRPSRTDQCRAAVHAAMGDVLEIVRFGAVVISRGCDGRDRHPMSAMRAGEEKTRQVRWRNALATHGAIPVPRPPGSIPCRIYEEVNKFLCDAQYLCIAIEPVSSLLLRIGRPHNFDPNQGPLPLRADLNCPRNQRRRGGRACFGKQNELVTQTGPGTPMGALFRCYWTPVLLAAVLPENDCPPVRVKVLSERLVAFRDSRGRETCRSISRSGIRRRRCACRS
jgi:hypothetical protein